MADMMISLVYDAVSTIVHGLNSTTFMFTNQSNFEDIRRAGKTLASKINNVSFHGLTVSPILVQPLFTKPVAISHF